MCEIAQNNIHYCPSCDAFSSHNLAYVKNHYRSHCPKVHCPKCDSQFQHLVSLKSHYRNTHPVSLVKVRFRERRYKAGTSPIYMLWNTPFTHFCLLKNTLISYPWSTQFATQRRSHICSGSKTNEYKPFHSQGKVIDAYNSFLFLFRFFFCCSSQFLFYNRFLGEVQHVFTIIFLSIFLCKLWRFLRYLCLFF